MADMYDLIRADIPNAKCERDLGGQEFGLCLKADRCQANAWCLCRSGWEVESCREAVEWCMIL